MSRREITGHRSPVAYCAPPQPLLLSGESKLEGARARPASRPTVGSEYLGPQPSPLRPPHAFTLVEVPALSKGFTLVEVMFSILILGIGLVAVASLFPIAGAIQRDTFEDVTAIQVAQNIKSAVKARGIGTLDLMVADPLSGYNPTLLGEVQPLPTRILDWDATTLSTNPPPGIGAQVNWLLSDRGYPAPTGDYRPILIPPPYIGYVPTNPPTDQPYYWVPLIVKDALIDDTRVYAFILKRQPGVDLYVNTFLGDDANPLDPPTVPHVKSILVRPDLSDNRMVTILPASKAIRAAQVFEAGDWVLDSAGNIHRVVDLDTPADGSVQLSGRVDPKVKKLWYGVRGNSSPTRQIVAIGNKLLVPIPQ